MDAYAVNRRQSCEIPDRDWFCDLPYMEFSDERFEFLPHEMPKINYAIRNQIQHCLSSVSDSVQDVHEECFGLHWENRPCIVFSFLHKPQCCCELCILRNFASAKKIFINAADTPEEAIDRQARSVEYFSTVSTLKQRAMEYQTAWDKEYFALHGQQE